MLLHSYSKGRAIRLRFPKDQAYDGAVNVAWDANAALMMSVTQKAV